MNLSILSLYLPVHIILYHQTKSWHHFGTKVPKNQAIQSHIIYQDGQLTYIDTTTFYRPEFRFYHPPAVCCHTDGRLGKRISAGAVLSAVLYAVRGWGQPVGFLSGGDGDVVRSIRKNGGYFLLSRGARILPPLAACLTNAADASRCGRSFGRVGRILVPRDS